MEKGLLISKLFAFGTLISSLKVHFKSLLFGAFLENQLLQSLVV